MPSLDRDRPFDDLPMLPPAFDAESPEIMRACIRASRSLSEMKGFIETIPEKKILLELLPLQESESSSAIENIVSSKKRLFMATSGNLDPNDRFTKEIVGYNKALNAASGKIPDIGTMKTICSIILDTPVEFRGEDDELVGLFSIGSKKPVYTPPSGRCIPSLMKNLQEYIFTDDDLDPLIKMAIIHYQFEAIHPFFDGNGRSGRILNVIYLQYSKLLNDPILFLSGYIIHHKTRYYELLNAVSTEGGWEKWILFMLDAIDETSRRTIGLIRGIVGLMETCRIKCGELRIPLNCTEVIFSNPFCSIKMMQESLGCSRPSATKYIRSLVHAGILRASKSKSMTIYENVGLMDLFS